MINVFLETMKIEQQRQAVHDGVRAEHDTNRLLAQRGNGRSPQNPNWFTVLTHLRRVRIQISFDVEEIRPKPEGAGC